MAQSIPSATASIAALAAAYGADATSVYKALRDSRRFAELRPFSPLPLQANPVFLAYLAQPATLPDAPVSARPEPRYSRIMTAQCSPDCRRAPRCPECVNAGIEIARQLGRMVGEQRAASAVADGLPMA